MWFEVFGDVQSYLCILGGSQAYRCEYCSMNTGKTFDRGISIIQGQQGSMNGPDPTALDAAITARGFDLAMLDIPKTISSHTIHIYNHHFKIPGV